MLTKLLALITTLFMTTTSFAKVDWNQKTEDFNFNGVELNKVIKKVSKITGRNFIVSPILRGKVYIFNAHPVTIQEAYDAFKTTLAIQGFGILKSGSHWVIRPARQLQRDNLPVYENELPPKTYDLATLIFTFKNADVQKVAANIRILPSKDGELTVNPRTNQLIITDFAPNLHRVWNLLKALDQKQRKRK